MRDATFDRTRTAVLDQVLFRLDSDKFRQFAEILDAPPIRGPGLECLLAVTPPWAEPATQCT
ncbi:MAG: DUF1778 domain-containing protein [Noviherbaspirillum sp.]